MKYSLSKLFKWMLYAAFILPAIWKITTNFEFDSFLASFVLTILFLPLCLIPNLIDYWLGNNRSPDQNGDSPE